MQVPTGSGTEILLATKVTLGSAFDPPICGIPQAACDNATRVLREQVASKLEVCSALGKRAIRRSVRIQFDACIVELNALEANMTQQADSCAALPAPCSGRGNCTEGVCSCEESWYGVACSVQPSCRYWDVNASRWSTDGCRMLTLSANGSSAGRAVCACDHLTEFAVVSNVLTRPDAFFSALSRLKVNLPFPTSWSAFVESLERVTFAEAATVGFSIVAALLLLHFTALLDDAKAYINSPPAWRRKLGELTAAGYSGIVVWGVAAVALFIFEEHHLLLVLVVNRATGEYGYSELLIIGIELTLSETAAVILFWGTSADNKDPLVQLWATLVGMFIKFIVAFIGERSLHPSAHHNHVRHRPQAHVEGTAPSLRPRTTALSSRPRLPHVTRVVPRSLLLLARSSRRGYP